MTRAKYIQMVAPLAMKARKEYPSLFASLAIAQAALESGSGRSELSKEYNNHFGIKANPAWKGKVVSMRTREVYNQKDVLVVDGFRVYDSIEDSFADRNRFLARNRRYTTNGVFSATTPQGQARALQKAGYATDPDYSAKLIGIIKANNLERYDVAADPEPILPVPPKPAEPKTQPEVAPIPIPMYTANEQSLAMRIFLAIKRILSK